MGRMAGIGVGMALALAGAAASAQQSPAVLGRWLSESRKGVVEIYPCSDRLCGRIIWLQEPLGDDGRPATDRNNPDATLRSRPVCGLVILGGFKASAPADWRGGWIYSPENGKTYHAQMTLESGNVLKLRGYVGIPLFGETQTWTRADPALDGCRPGG